MGCFFSKRINGNFTNSFKNPEKASACNLPKYLWNGYARSYIICEGDFRKCPVKDRYVSVALENYWESDERKNHEMLRHHAQIENGRKL